MTIPDIAAHGYTAAGDDYERTRPEYPSDALELLLAELGIRRGSKVLDLGAGTGKLTRLLRPSGASVVAVEPVEAMRRHLVAAMPDVPAIEGTAEAIPLGDESVDSVLVGTAFHWFEAERALGEIARVLRPGGGLGLVWNNPDLEVDWVADIWGLIGTKRRGAPRNRDLRWKRAFEHPSAFSALQHRTFAHVQELGREDLIARVRSISYVASLPAPEREDVLQRVREIATTHPQLAGREPIRLPYRTDVYWCHKQAERSPPR